MKKFNFQHFRFIKTERIGIYDKFDEDISNPFNFLKFEHPRSQILIDNGVKSVLMSWKNRKKILHTGLIPISENYFIGNNLNSNSKKDFILIYHDKMNLIFHLFIVKNRNPKKKTKFGLELMEYLEFNKKTINY